MAMIGSVRRTCLAAVALLAALGTAPGWATEWVKGNTHAHSTLSDGNLPPEGALGWYRDHGYGFAFLTDHHTCAPASVFASLTTPTFVALPGEEISSTAGDVAGSVHVNALGLCPEDAGPGPALDLAPVTTDVPRDALMGALEVARGAGLAQLNHPTLLLTDPAACRVIPDGILVEVYNNGVARSPLAPLALPAFEQTWDAILTNGRHAWGVASDDTHRYAAPAKDILDTPGGGWVMVRVEELTPANVLDALRRGDFYASTGVTLEDVAFDGQRLSLRVDVQPGLSYKTRFVGARGAVLATVEGAEPSYELTGAPAEAYVRARVDASDGTRAWVQPVWPGAGQTGTAAGGQVR
jgi:hypothetical protein